MYLACRSAAKAEEAVAALEAETGGRAIFLPLDLASLDSIKEAAAEFQRSPFLPFAQLALTQDCRQESSLDILFNNACAPSSLPHSLDDACLIEASWPLLWTS